MKTIDEKRLEANLEYRFGYLCEFMGFGLADRQAIQAVSIHLLPLVPQFVDGFYAKLFDYDATRRHLVPQQSGYKGELPADIAALSLGHPVLEFRKAHLASYFLRLFNGEVDAKMLDYVGQMHTAQAGSRELHIPLVQMNAMLGLLADAIVSTLLELNVDHRTRNAAVRAFGKLFWLQNDLINRHYQGPSHGTDGHERRLS